MPMMSESKTITRDPGWSGPTVSPREMLLEEFLEPLGLQQVEAAKRLGISANRESSQRGHSRKTPGDARYGAAVVAILHTSAQFWMRLQADWDVHQATVQVCSAHGQTLTKKRTEPTSRQML